MPTFCVSLYNEGKPEPGARQIVARNPKQAAEAIAGERLVALELLGPTRARVWEANVVPTKLTYFCRVAAIRSDCQ